jgi:hypothetical protein
VPSRNLLLTSSWFVIYAEAVQENTAQNNNNIMGNDLSSSSAPSPFDPATDRFGKGMDKLMACNKNLEDRIEKLNAELKRSNDIVSSYHANFVLGVMHVCKKMFSLSTRFVDYLKNRDDRDFSENIESILVDYLHDLDKLDGILLSRCSFDKDSTMIKYVDVHGRPFSDMLCWIYLYGCLIAVCFGDKKNVGVLNHHCHGLKRVLNNIVDAKNSISGKLSGLIDKDDPDNLRGYLSYICLLHTNNNVMGSLAKFLMDAKGGMKREKFNFSCPHAHASDFVKHFGEGIKLFVFLSFWSYSGEGVNVCDIDVRSGIEENDERKTKTPVVIVSYVVSRDNTLMPPPRHHRLHNAAASAIFCRNCGLHILTSMRPRR